jgi:hypothetical protein
LEVGGNMSDLKSPVIGQTIPHIDRDTFQEQKIAPAPTEEKPNEELDELFKNFRTVLLGKDVSTTQKGMVLWTVLENYKHGTPEVSSRSRALLTDILLTKSGGV